MKSKPSKSLIVIFLLILACIPLQGCSNKDTFELLDSINEFTTSEEKKKATISSKKEDTSNEEDKSKEKKTSIEESTPIEENTDKANLETINTDTVVEINSTNSDTLINVDNTDTVRWFNAAFAILTKSNRQDYNLFGGLPINNENRNMMKASLEAWWSVTNRASADSTLDWVLNEGHRTDFKEGMLSFEEIGFGNLGKEERRTLLINNNFTVEEVDFITKMYSYYEEYGEDAIAGWDYCRGLNLTSFYYLSGYYTKEEALNKSLEIAKKIQPKFNSWDELIESYLRGYEYWSRESSDERRAIYEDLKARDDNPYAIDYNTELVKTW